MLSVWDCWQTLRCCCLIDRMYLTYNQSCAVLKIALETMTILAFVVFQDRHHGNLAECDMTSERNSCGPKEKHGSSRVRTREPEVIDN